MPASEPSDDRLRELLAVEERLQRLVADAREASRRRIAEAQEAAGRLLANAEAAAEEADAAQARLDLAAHEDARLSLERRHQATLASLSAVPDATVERLADQVLEHLLRVDGGPP